MPKVTFINEHRVVEAEKGRLISEVADAVGIATCRAAFAGRKAGGNHVVWVKGAPNAVSAPGMLEKLLGGGKGWRRLANRTRIYDDIEVWTQSIDNRLRSPRPIDPPPRPSTDKGVPRHPADASGTAAF